MLDERWKKKKKNTKAKHKVHMRVEPLFIPRPHPIDPNDTSTAHPHISRAAQREIHPINKKNNNNNSKRKKKLDKKCIVHVACEAFAHSFIRPFFFSHTLLSSHKCSAAHHFIWQRWDKTNFGFILVQWFIKYWVHHPATSSHILALYYKRYRTLCGTESFILECMWFEAVLTEVKILCCTIIMDDVNKISKRNWSKLVKVGLLFGSQAGIMASWMGFINAKSREMRAHDMYKCEYHS